MSAAEARVFDRKSHAERAWDWGFLDDACPGKISVSDVDGILTYGKDRVLIIETKPAIQAKGGIPRGQWFSLCRLAARGCDVLIVYGEPGEPVWLREIPGDGLMVASREILFDYIERWFANGGRRAAG